MNKQNVKQLANEHGIQIVETTIKLNESGLDFQVAHAEDTTGQKWILRIPRRADSMRSAEIEKAVLDTVNKHVSFQSPLWVIYTNELIAYKQLSGVPAGTVDPENQNYIWELDVENIPDSYHKSLGHVLAELHHVPIKDLSISGLTVHTADQARQSMKQRMDRVKHTLGVSDELWKKWQAWLENEPMWPKTTGLSHGDLHPGHELINDQSEVTGLIDWTEVSVTDVSRDFVTHYMVAGVEGLEKTIAAYEQAGGNTWPLMKEHIIELAGANAIGVAEFAAVSGLKEYEDMAKQMLGVSE
ncbi:macrolide 2'-phosphotransferase [Shouchella patagoniensis]|uniref:macrolide 2'-phosphotransferase n=1 Tax=Shouchella patagoniensis TaxID=228576 RepID=UPI0009959B6C|nr:macrolide 2'-phosphotransferase [Shouchella patagoniensis]